MKRNSIQFLLSLLACACIVLAATVTTDYNHSTDFSQYKTYSWLKVEAGDPLWPDRIKNAVESQFAPKAGVDLRYGNYVSEL